MSSKLIIVESPSKAKTINSYLGNDFLVLSSIGHIRELATSGVGGLGLDVKNDFKPDYKIGKGKNKIVTQLKKEAKQKTVLIATDPDREGEAIAWHLADVLNLDLNLENRIVFSEITKNAVLDAVNAPRKIDLNLVKSQEVRRALDRIIGFKLSALLRKKIKSKSAGRVQSVALKLIVDLEKEIRAFIPEEYYEIEARFENFTADYIIKKGIKLKKDDAMRIVEDSKNPFIVKSIDSKKSNRSAKPAFTTSTLQQDANINLNMSGANTMRIAQQLYEGIEIDGEIIGLITYMRSDSTRLSDEFVDSTKRFILENFNDSYLGKYNYEKKDKSQDAHEAIRPTSINRTPESIRKYLDEYQFKIYERIYNRALASLMSDAIFQRTKVFFDTNGNLYDLNGVIQIFDGFLRVYDEQKTKDVLLPKFEIGEKYNANEVVAIRKETQPKSRYTEATLIKEMEKLGIGRPSTYALIIQTLKAPDRNYINIEKKKLIPTEKGIFTSDKLDEFFNKIINVEYTSKMESDLDLISEGLLDNINLLRNFYDEFMPMIKFADLNMAKIEPVLLNQNCPECGAPLVLRSGKYGEFVGCSAFPMCKYIQKNE